MSPPMLLDSLFLLRLGGSLSVAVGPLSLVPDFSIHSIADGLHIFLVDDPFDSVIVSLLFSLLSIS